MNFLKHTLVTLAMAAGIFTGAAIAQTPTSADPSAPVADVPYQPNYFLAAGADYDYFGKTPSALTVFGVKVADKTYNLTNLNLFNTSGQSAAAIESGILRLVAQQGNWSFGLLGQAGVVASAASTLGQLNGGAMIAYDVGQQFKSSHFYVVAFGTVQAINGTQVKPVFGFALGKTF